MAETITHHEINAGVCLQVRQRGPMDAPPIVLLHGLTDGGITWGRVMRALADDYRLIAPSLRCHEGSSGPEEGFTLQDVAEDILRLLDALKPGPAWLVGHSMGAAVALLLAARAPERFRGLMLDEPPFKPGAGSEAGTWLTELVQAQDIPHAELIERYRAAYPHWESDEDRAHFATARQAFNLNFFRDFAFGEGPPWQAVLAQVPMPLQVIVGAPERGSMTTPDNLAEIRQFAPQAPTLVHLETGHHPRCEAYEAYMEHLRHFLNRQDKNEDGR